MPDKKIIAVTGATGSQGGGLVRAILADPNGGFAVRALTRNVNSEKARALQKLGAAVTTLTGTNSYSGTTTIDRWKETYPGKVRGTADPSLRSG
jgi:autotransporter-associated beta strand protein